MMYAKLALRNVKRSAKDYLIYVITLIFIIICRNPSTDLHPNPIIKKLFGELIRIIGTGCIFIGIIRIDAKSKTGLPGILIQFIFYQAI